MSASLLVDAGGQWAQNVHLRKGEETYIGRRPDNHVRINDQTVSSRHAVLSYNGKVWIIRDLKTPNGTIVNGMRVGEAQLRNGDMIRIGSSDIVFRDKESEVPEDVWGRTSLKFLEDHGHILTEGANPRKADDRPLVLPGIEQASPSPPGSGASRPIPITRTRTPVPVASDDFQGFEFHGAAADEPEKPRMTAEDYRWLAEQVTMILGEVSRKQGITKNEMHELVLGRLCQAIGADNGFLTIPNHRTKRWIIEAWVGNNDSWSESDSEQPMPLTVTNQAYKQNTVLSNALGSSELGAFESASMISLNVTSYIAVPLQCGGEKAGVLYFDTRRPLKKFHERDVKLIEQVGDYILELNKQLGGNGSESGIHPTPSRQGPAPMPAPRHEPEPISSFNDLPWPDLMEQPAAPPPSSSTRRIPLAVKKHTAPPPQQSPDYNEKIARLRHAEFALILPVDRPIRVKEVEHVLVTLEGLDPEEAHQALIDRKGIIAERLSYSDIVDLGSQPSEGDPPFLCVAVPAELRPKPPAEPSQVRLGETGMVYSTDEGNQRLEWKDVRLVSCGRLERQPVLDFFVPHRRLHVRLRHDVLDFPSLIDSPDDDPNVAARKLLIRLLRQTTKAARSHTVANLVDGRTGKPQKFSTDKDYAEYNWWLILAHFAERLSLREAFQHAAAST